MEKTEKLYQQLSAEERATIMLIQREGSGLREMGRFLKRSPSTISRELACDLGSEQATRHRWRASKRLAGRAAD